MLRFLFDYIKKYRKTFVYSGFCIALSLVLISLARTVDGFAQCYATKVFPLFPNTLGRLFSLLPFSVFELGLYLTFLILFFLLIKILWLALHRKPALKLLVSKIFRRSLCILSSLLLVFTLTGSINYSRAAFASDSGLLIQDSTDEELTRLCLLLIQDASKLVSQIQIDENGSLSLSQMNAREEAVAAMKKLGNLYPTLSDYYPNPKPILLSDAVSYLGITGIYSPFTLEANYNRNVAAFVIPYTLCHELAHLKGYMKEEEAGFIAYSACRDSSSAAFQYSGALNALMYSLNALYENVDKEEYKAVYDQIPEQIRQEFEYSRYYWQQHTAAITSIAKTANDQYLIANAQAAGTKSYGKMVDLLLAEYADVISQGILL